MCLRHFQVKLRGFEASYRSSSMQAQSQIGRKARSQLPGRDTWSANVCEAAVAADLPREAFQNSPFCPTSVLANASCILDWFLWCSLPFAFEEAMETLLQELTAEAAKCAS